MTACDYDLVVTSEGDINAYADGERVIVPWPMMRFANDEELTSIVGHEIAHNAMGHGDARIQNVILGGLLGAVLDAAAGEDVDADSSATAEFMAAAAEAVLAGLREGSGLRGRVHRGQGRTSAGGGARHLAQVRKRQSGRDFLCRHASHTAERFVRLREIIEEIEAKIRAGEELLPEFARQ